MVLILNLPIEICSYSWVLLKKDHGFFLIHEGERRGEGIEIWNSQSQEPWIDSDEMVLNCGIHETPGTIFSDFSKFSRLFPKERMGKFYLKKHSRMGIKMKVFSNRV